MIATCDPCVPPRLSQGAAYQEREHGPNKRVMNPMPSGKYRCTVCSKEHAAGTAGAPRPDAEGGKKSAKKGSASHGGASREDRKRGRDKQQSRPGSRR